MLTLSVNGPWRSWDAAPGVKKEKGYDLQQALLTKGINANVLATAGFKAAAIAAAQKAIKAQGTPLTRVESPQQRAKTGSSDQISPLCF